MSTPMHSPRNWPSITGTAFALCITGMSWRHWHTALSLAAFVIALLLFLAALALPEVWRRIQAGLDLFARAVMVSVSYLVLGIIFLLCFIPGRLLLLLRKSDPLDRAYVPERKSYFEPIDSTASGERFRRQF